MRFEAMLGSIAYAFLLSRFRLSRSAEFTLISIASLFFVKHLVYDYVFLVVVLCFALTQKSFKTKAIIIGAVLAFWFFLPRSIEVQRVIPALILHGLP